TFWPGSKVASGRAHPTAATKGKVPSAARRSARLPDRTRLAPHKRNRRQGEPQAAARYLCVGRARDITSLRQACEAVRSAGPPCRLPCCVHAVTESIFKRFAARYTVAPATDWSGGLRLVFDIETDGLLNNATKVHCIVVGDLDRDEIAAYDPTEIAAAL